MEQFLPLLLLILVAMYLKHDRRKNKTIKNDVSNFEAGQTTTNSRFEMQEKISTHDDFYPNTEDKIKTKPNKSFKSKIYENKNAIGIGILAMTCLFCASAKSKKASNN